MNRPEASCARGPEGRTELYEPGALSRRALRALGLNIDAPVEQYRRAYERFLPDAVGIGLYPLLPGEVAKTDSETELRWLSERLVIRAPRPGDVWWSDLWTEAAHEISGPQPQELTPPGIQVLLRRLLRARRRQEVVNALAEAMRAQSAA